MVIQDLPTGQAIEGLNTEESHEMEKNGRY